MHASSLQTSQPVPVLPLLTGGDPARGDDVRSVSAFAAELEDLLSERGGATIAVAPAAQAADVFPGNPTGVPSAFFNVSGDPFMGAVSATYGRSGIGAGTFTDNFLFTFGDPRGGFGSGSITTILSGALGNVTDQLWPIARHASTHCDCP